MRLCTIYNHWCFSRKYAQFTKLFDMNQSILNYDHILSDKAQKKIEILNTSRIEIQNMIEHLGLPSLSVCDKCNGGCCQGSIGHYFTSLDFWLRKHSADKIVKPNLSEPKEWYYYIHKRLKQLTSRIFPSRKVSASKTGCYYLGPDGCKLKYADRPIKCVVSTCPRLRAAMDKQTRIKYSKLIKELFLLSCNAFDILKKEAGLPKRHGRLSLMLTL